MCRVDSKFACSKSLRNGIYISSMKGNPSHIIKRQNTNKWEFLTHGISKSTPKSEFPPFHPGQDSAQENSKVQKCWSEAVNKSTSVSVLLSLSHQAFTKCPLWARTRQRAVILWYACPLQLFLLPCLCHILVVFDNAAGLGANKEGQNELKGIALLLEECSH